jgi:hypothetical protein
MDFGSIQPTRQRPHREKQNFLWERSCGLFGSHHTGNTTSFSESDGLALTKPPWPEIALPSAKLTLTSPPHQLGFLMTQTCWAPAVIKGLLTHEIVFLLLCVTVWGGQMISANNTVNF